MSHRTPSGTGMHRCFTAMLDHPDVRDDAIGDAEDEQHGRGRVAGVVQPRPGTPAADSSSCHSAWF